MHKFEREQDNFRGVGRKEGKKVCRQILIRNFKIQESLTFTV